MPFTVQWDPDQPASTGNLEVQTYTKHTHKVQSETLLGEMVKLVRDDIKHRFQRLPREFKEKLQELYHGKRGEFGVSRGSSMPALVKSCRPPETKKSISDDKVDVDYCALMRYTVVQAQPEGAEEVAECLANSKDEITYDHVNAPPRLLPKGPIDGITAEDEIGEFQNIIPQAHWNSAVRPRSFGILLERTASIVGNM